MGLTMSYIQTVHTLLSNVVTRIFNALPFLTRERTPFLTTFSSPASPPSCLSVCLSVCLSEWYFLLSLLCGGWTLAGERSESVPDSHAPTLPNNYGRGGCAPPNMWICDFTLKWPGRTHIFRLAKPRGTAAGAVKEWMFINRADKDWDEIGFPRETK